MNVPGERYANLDVAFSNAILKIEDHGGYESRHSSMIKLMKDAWHIKVKSELKPEPLKFFTLYTDDCFNPHLHFSFAGTRDQSHRLMPHFIFEAWPECGMDNYEEVFGRMLEEGQKPPSEERAFWSGAMWDRKLFPQCFRDVGHNLSRKRPDLFEFRQIKWRNRGPDQHRYTPGYIPLPDHCRYSVLVDFSGVGFSARLPLLLASGRPVVVVGRPQEAWFYWDEGFIPWMHYVPCGTKDGFGISESSLEAAIRWALENRDKASEIGRNGREYAAKNLTRSAAVERIGLMMEGFCKDMWRREFF